MARSFRLESRTSRSGRPAPSIWPMRMPTALPMDRNTTLDRFDMHHIQAAGGVALIQNGNTGGPEEFVDQQGHTLHRDSPQELAGNIGGAVGAPNKGIALRVQVGPAGYKDQFHEPGDYPPRPWQERQSGRKSAHS